MSKCFREYGCRLDEKIFRTVGKSVSCQYDHSAAVLMPEVTQVIKLVLQST
jgi:hypothetical protein